MDKMNVTWLGTASILISCGDIRLLFDPYLRRHNPALPPFPLEKIADVNAIFITHPHLDHFADLSTIMECCSAPVYVCERGVEIAGEQDFDTTRLRRIHAGDTLRLGNVEIRAWQSCHCMYDRLVVRETLSRALRPTHLKEGLSIEGENHRFRIDMHNDVLAYEICADDKCVFLMGSANCREDVDYPTDMDLLVWPFQGRSDIAEYSLPFLERFRPRRVMLDHFDDAFPPVSTRIDCDPFLESAARLYPEIEIFAPEERIAYEV